MAASHLDYLTVGIRASYSHRKLGEPKNWSRRLGGKKLLYVPGMEPRFLDLLCCHLWLVWHRRSFPHYFTNDTIFGKKVVEHKMCSDFLGAFAISQKETCLCYVHLSVRIEQLSSHWTDFDETVYLSFFRKHIEKIQISLKSDRNNGCFTRRRFHIYDNISLNSF